MKTEINAELKTELEKRCLLALPTLQKTIGKYVKDYNDQCDVLQEVMAIGWQKISELKEPYNVEGWLSTIARNYCFSWLKNKSKTCHIPDESLIPDIEIQTIEVSMDEYEHLLGGINRLPYALRTVIQMKYFTHNSIKDISKLLQLPEGTVKRRLHDARKKLKKEFGMNNSKSTPKITITLKEGKVASVKRLGYGLNFGSPLAGVGDIEIYEAYEYPGQFLVNKFSSEVTRKTIMMGQEVIEVHDKSILAKKETGTEKFYYYQLQNDLVTMTFRVLNFPKKLKIDIEADELMTPQLCTIKTGEYHEEEDNIFAVNDLVDLQIGDRIFENAIRRRLSSDDYHGRCYMEKFYNREGREVLHRNYIGKEWKMGDYIKWEKWKDSPEVEFNGEKFRLWFEFVLVDNYRKEED